MDLSFRNSAAVAGNFHALDKRLQRDLKKIVRSAGELTKDYTQALVPIDTKFMHDNVRVVYSKDGRVFECGWDQADFDAAGLPFYPIYVEFGTSKMAAQPSLYPAYQEVKPLLLADVRDALRAAISRKRSTQRRR